MFHKKNIIIILLLFCYSKSVRSQCLISDSIKHIEIYAIPFLLYENDHRYYPIDIEKIASTDSSMEIINDKTIILNLSRSKQINLKKHLKKRKQDFVDSRLVIKYVYSNSTQVYYINSVELNWINYIESKILYKQKYNSKYLSDIASVIKNKKLILIFKSLQNKLR